MNLNCQPQTRALSAQSSADPFSCLPSPSARKFATGARATQVLLTWGPRSDTAWRLMDTHRAHEYISQPQTHKGIPCAGEAPGNAALAHAAPFSLGPGVIFLPECNVRARHTGTCTKSKEIQSSSWRVSALSLSHLLIFPPAPLTGPCCLFCILDRKIYFLIMVLNSWSTFLLTWYSILQSG